MYPCDNSNVPNSWRELSALGSERRIVHPDSPAALYKDKGKKALLYLDGLYWAACLCLSIPSSCALQLKIPLHEEGQLSSPSGKTEPDKDLCENNSGITQKWSVMRRRFFSQSSLFLLVMSSLGSLILQLGESSEEGSHFSFMRSRLAVR